ncbi:MAG: Hsp20/alpha crystallin family protein [Planctomycetota bacterium]|nr:Hsp20/alpha crystallin family protein [Planctomycetota bacterium]
MTKAMTRSRSLFPFGPFWDEFFKSDFGVAPASATQLRPALDVSESEDAITVSIELPGLGKDAVQVSIEDGVLTVTGEKKSSEDRKDDSFHIVERRYGSFSRSLTLPTTVNPDQADASFEHGVLTIRLPKHEQVKPKRLEIK